MMPTELPLLADLPDEFLLCRRGGLMHSWQPNPTAVVDGDIARAASYVIALRCERCTKEKFIYLDSRYMRMGQYYRDVPGYAAQRAKADDVLAEIVSRSLLFQRLDEYSDGTVRLAAPPRRTRARKAS